MLIRKISLALIFLFLFTFNSYSQIQQIWQPPGIVGFITDPFGVLKYYYSGDNVNHVINIYYLENYSIIYSFPDSLTYPAYILPDMNGNGYPELLGSRYQQGGRIIDLKTHDIIYDWGPNSGCGTPFITPGSNVLKCIVYYNVGMESTYSLYSLGVNVSAIHNDNASLPKSMILKQNYPNPFNPSTRIEYDLPNITNVTVAIYNSAGQLVREFREGEKNQGHYSVVWDGKDERGSGVASGAYFYQVKAGDTFQTKKMMLLK